MTAGECVRVLVEPLVLLFEATAEADTVIELVPINTIGELVGVRGITEPEGDGEEDSVTADVSLDAEVLVTSGLEVTSGVVVSTGDTDTVDEEDAIGVCVGRGDDVDERDAVAEGVEVPVAIGVRVNAEVGV